MITEFAKGAPFELFKNEEVVDFMSLFFSNSEDVPIDIDFSCAFTSVFNHFSILSECHISFSNLSDKIT